MKTPDPKEELSQQLATSLLRDVFAAAVITGIYANPNERAGSNVLASYAFEQAGRMLARSHTPTLIEQLSKLKS